MSDFGIKAIGFASGVACPHEGEWLKSFDFDAYGGIGEGVFTKSAERAKRFKDAGEAMKFWRTQSKVKPMRDDGKPNRPFTALTVAIDPLP
jgi:hypothetical protein